MMQEFHSEAYIQQQIFMWFNNNYCCKHHTPRCIIFSVPNEGQQRLSATGVLGGVSDLILVTFAGVFFVEVKTHKGTQSPKQKDFEHRVTMLGYEYILVRNFETFKQWIEEKFYQYPHDGKSTECGIT
jgi:hypothetical protein